jgi:hypothetical protein
MPLIGTNGGAPVGRVAYIDEGYVSTTSHYLLAAVIVDGEHAEELRETTRALPRRGRSRFHWHSEHPADRAAMIAHIATSSSAGVVVVSQPMRETRSEGARAQCLGFLTAHCIALDPIVDHIVLESRTAVLDKRDAARINGLKSAGRLSPLMQFTFATRENRFSGSPTPLPVPSTPSWLMTVATRTSSGTR